MTQSDEQCVGCEYFRRNGHSAGAGECRRYPAVVFESKAWGEWPLVRDDNWCGEYKAKAN